MENPKVIKLVECPRDAMQGWPHLISTQQKAGYINNLLKVGFDTIDFGSFVSPKAIPQMADTKEVLALLDLADTDTKLLAIIANERGAEEAISFEKITYLGFPFSISETFQQKNTNSSIAASMKRVEAIQNLCASNGKQLVLYISMGFGNPYGDTYNEEIVFDYVKKMEALEIKIISLADTVGLATAAQVNSITRQLVDTMPAIEIGVHLHSTPAGRQEKLDAALEAGCRRFDGALKGIGGCPMAGNELVGNMDTEFMISHFASKGFENNLNNEALLRSSQMAANIFI